MSEQNVVKAVEVAPMQVVITLTPAQVKAFAKMDLTEQIQKIATNAVASAVKGKYKYVADKAEEQCSKLYEMATKNGAKFDKDRGSFIKMYMQEIKDILVEL